MKLRIHAQHKKKSSGAKTTAAESESVHNDFKREMGFYRQAQAAALEGLARLKSMNVPTKRPEDYFAQMAKTDEHMQKVMLRGHQLTCKSG